MKPAARSAEPGIPTFTGDRPQFPSRVIPDPIGPRGGAQEGPLVIQESVRLLGDEVFVPARVFLQDLDDLYPLFFAELGPGEPGDDRVAVIVPGEVREAKSLSKLTATSFFMRIPRGLAIVAKPLTTSVRRWRECPGRAALCSPIARPRK